MRRFFFVAAMLCLALTAMADEIKLKHVRPSRILAFLAQASPIYSGSGLTEAEGGRDGANLPKGMRIKADDAKGVLIVYGDAEEIAEIATFVALIDIPLRTLRAEVDVVAPLDMYRARTSTLIRNTMTWGMSDGMTGVRFDLATRLHDDNTVSIFFSLGPREKPQQFVIRAKVGQPVDIVFDDFVARRPMEEPIAINTSPARIVVGKPKPGSVVVTFRLTVVEDTPAKIK